MPSHKLYSNVSAIDLTKVIGGGINTSSMESHDYAATTYADHSTTAALAQPNKSLAGTKNFLSLLNDSSGPLRDGASKKHRLNKHTKNQSHSQLSAYRQRMSHLDA